MKSLRHDFRSDTVTRPGPAMRAAMAAAEVGDDVFGDDPTVNRLEAMAADRLGKQAALFFPTGTQSNLAALMAHCGRGDEYICGQEAHIYMNEQGGAPVLGSIMPQPIANQPDGTIELDAIAAAIRPDDPHYVRSRVLALENTIGGKVLPLAYMRDATALARKRGLGTHLDGARMFNAAVKLGVNAAEIAAPFDTVSVCLSKGLGAPAGTVLAGSADLIAKARRHRKVLGGAMRQSGILAAAGIHALENHVDRLADDHVLMAGLAEGLGRYDALTFAPPQTNILFVDVDPAIAAALDQCLADAGVGLISWGSGQHQRWVTHLDVGPDDVDAALTAVEGFFANA